MLSLVGTLIVCDFKSITILLVVCADVPTFLLDTKVCGTNSSAFSSSSFVTLFVGSSHVSDIDLKTKVFSLFSVFTLAGEGLRELLDDFEELVRLLLEELVEDELLELLEERRYRVRSCDFRSRYRSRDEDLLRVLVV